MKKTKLRDLEPKQEPVREMADHELRMAVGGGGFCSTGHIRVVEAWSAPNGPDDIFRVDHVYQCQGN